MDHAAEERLNELARQRERKGWLGCERPLDQRGPIGQMDHAPIGHVHEQAQPPKRQKRLRLERPPKKNPRKWVHATGTPGTLERKAAMYLKFFNHKEARAFDSPELTLAKVICNLRKYYLQSREATIKLVREFFNARSPYAWSAEGIGLTWDLVEPYTPNMGLEDDTAVNRERAADLYERVVDMVLMLEPKGRVLVSDLYRYFLAMNPDLNPVPTDVAVGIAVGDVTGKKSASSKGRKYYSGFRIPKEHQLPAAA